jgi:hypothetical protein
LLYIITGNLQDMWTALWNNPCPNFCFIQWNCHCFVPFVKIKTSSNQLPAALDPLQVLKQEGPFLISRYPSDFFFQKKTKRLSLYEISELEQLQLHQNIPCKFYIFYTLT